MPARTVAHLVRYELEGLRDEGEDEYHEGGAGGEHRRCPADVVVERARMPEAEERRRDRRPQEPAGPAAETEPDEEGDERRGDDTRLRPSAR
jgi:hypothetical protein